MSKFIACRLVLSATGIIALSQAQTVPKEFDVATVKANAANDNRFMIRPLPGGGLQGFVDEHVAILSSQGDVSPRPIFIGGVPSRAERPVSWYPFATLLSIFQRRPHGKKEDEWPETKRGFHEAGHTGREIGGNHWRSTARADRSHQKALGLHSRA